MTAPPRTLGVLASALAAGLMLTVASCSNITPIGPGSTPTMPPPRHLASPIIMQVMRGRPATATGGCLAGWVGVFLPPGAPPLATPCYRPVGTPVTITSAAVSAVSTYRPPPGQPDGSPSYGFMVAVPAAEVAAVTAVIKQAYNSRGALGVSVGGKLWEAPQVRSQFSGQQFQITLFSRNQALQLHRILVPSG